MSLNELNKRRSFLEGIVNDLKKESLKLRINDIHFWEFAKQLLK